MYKISKHAHRLRERYMMTHAILFFCSKLIESWEYFDGLVQDSSNTIINALELLQSCTIDLILKYLINELKKGEELQIPLMN